MLTLTIRRAPVGAWAGESTWGGRDRTVGVVFGLAMELSVAQARRTPIPFPAKPLLFHLVSGSYALDI